MKTYISEGVDTCWSDCLGCILEIEPHLVPKFVKKHGDKYMDFTRDWLAKNFKKGMVYVPSRVFMETGKLRLNCPIGPMGYSIGHLSMVDAENNHAVVCFNGGVVWDNGNSREDEYGEMLGYFVLYDLEPKKVKLTKKPRKRRKKK